MKLCPICESRFPDTDQFCELDGAQLVYEDSDDDLNMAVPRFERDPHNTYGVVEGAGVQPYRPARGSETWKILAILAIASVVIAAVLFFVYQQMTGDSNKVVNGESANVSAAQQQPLLTAQPAAIASASPSPETSPSPSATPSPSANADAARAVLSSSPVSTGADEKLKGGAVSIRLTNGTSVDADEVWETGEGIWYRRSGLVTLLERDQVASIVRTPPAPSPTATPETSPGENQQKPD